jgi:hypothetical protein
LKGGTKNKVATKLSFLDLCEEKLDISRKTLFHQELLLDFPGTNNQLFSKKTINLKEYALFHHLISY